MVLLVGYSFSLETIYELIGSGLGESASEVAQSGLKLAVALACVEVCAHVWTTRTYAGSVDQARSQ